MNGCIDTLCFSLIPETTALPDSGLAATLRDMIEPEFSSNSKTR